MSQLLLAQTATPNLRPRRAMQRLSVRRSNHSSAASRASQTACNNGQYETGSVPATAKQQHDEPAASWQKTEAPGSLQSTITVPSSQEQKVLAELSLEELYQRFQADGPVVADHSRRTKQLMKIEETKWVMFCQHREKDPDEELRRGDATLFKVYLVFRVKRSRIKKQSSIMTYWKTLSMVYAQKIRGFMNDCILFDIRNWIHTELTPDFCLDTSQKEKAGLYIEDLALLLNQLWIRDEGTFEHERLRVQHAETLILAGATATRPGALIGSVLYEHWEFQVFPPVEGSKRARLVLIVNLEHIKRTAGDSEPKKFAFREDDMLLYDPIVPALALVFSDNAFLNCFQSAEDIYNLKVPPNQDRIRLLWKEEWRKRPIFRDVVEMPDGTVVSGTKALSYDKERRHLVRLGRSTGFEKQLQWYDLRRGSGKKINEELTPEERNKIMGHRKGDSSTYLTYYMSNFIDRDCQSICFGSAPQQDLIHLAARLQRHDAAPMCLTAEQLAEINEDEDLKALRSTKARAVQAWKDLGYRSKEAATGTAMRADYDRYSKEADKLSKYLKGIRLRQVIETFHTNIHVEEVDRQLRGIKPADIIAPPNIQYDLAERAHVAQLYAAAAKISGADQLHAIRVELVRCISQLCSRRESRSIRQKAQMLARTSTARGTLPIDAEAGWGGETTGGRPRRADMPDRTERNAGSAELICAFCRWQGNHGSADRRRTQRMSNLARHMKLMHLKRLRMPFPCPWPDCEAILGNRQHLASHFRHHGQDLPPSFLR
ncbi:FluG domain-containing protein [Cordyceps javanica]|uniref:FluG domain-containing protein n=1 Tax=Cordyceps javanica TaxID=43265 RepID=A0A545UL93_9HYPO|nr:FluG domain-containing protein [Cordyceps javanica]TQW01674.1 FluG domain-containing protein [Cordyceps javanica]